MGAVKTVSGRQNSGVEPCGKPDNPPESFGCHADAMVKPPPPSFGRARRPQAQARPPLPLKRRAVPAPQAPVARHPEDPVAAELAAWKQSRPRQSFPWRQVSLILGLCFAVASLVLPQRVNDAAAYGLYALSAASFISGFKRRRQRPS
jgi:hypothetical protein